MFLSALPQAHENSHEQTQDGCESPEVHRSYAFIQQIPKWVKRGLVIKYLPAYSPQLNLIEILWRFMKYTWLPFSAYTSFARLCQAVAQILKQFGTEYRIDFKTA